MLQDIGSILLGRTSEEEAGLEARQAMLTASGVTASLLSGSELRRLEPSLAVSSGSSGLLVDSDAQLVSLYSTAHIHVHVSSAQQSSGMI